MPIVVDFAQTETTLEMLSVVQNEGVKVVTGSFLDRPSYPPPRTKTLPVVWNSIPGMLHTDVMPRRRHEAGEV